MAIKIIKDKCKGCTLCAKACPFDALKNRKQTRDRRRRQMYKL